MTNEAHWFAFFCPYFTAHDIHRLMPLISHQELTVESLALIGSDRAAHWFSRFGTQWRAFKNTIPVLEERAAAAGLELLLWGQTGYPQKLSRLAFPPGLLFMKGRNEFTRKNTVAIVGARHPTHLGRLWVQEIVPELVKNDIAVVSGGARGIDAEAHYSAVETGGTTVAVLPGGLDRPYPVGNRDIFDRICFNGALLSEYPCNTMVRATHFHRRNRLIAGLADVVVVVEAARKSGTLITANRALSENIDVLIVPGPAMIASYEGSLDLLGQGAGLARDHHDILAAIQRRCTAEKNVLKKEECSPTLEP
jgi:DNA processing protein